MFGSVRRESRLYHLHLDFRWRQTVEPFGVLLLVFGGSFFVFNMARGKQTFWNFLLFILLITLCKGSGMFVLTFYSSKYFSVIYFSLYYYKGLEFYGKSGFIVSVLLDLNSDHYISYTVYIILHFG
ncbi:hypothetical protein XENTR_v10018174 [Xenopus tropicalis]|nr:hypothetical protein XENTR_v10018174 [Xenopus tropicalis]